MITIRLTPEQTRLVLFELDMAIEEETSYRNKATKQTDTTHHNQQIAKLKRLVTIIGTAHREQAD